MTIHVTDDKKGVYKDFSCPKDVLLSQMKYFEKHLNMADSPQDIDISVQCDIDIFEWLMKYVKKQKNQEPLLELQNVVPILISGDFLEMRVLVEECAKFMATNLQLMTKVPLDMSNISQFAISKISENVSLSQLDSFEDRKDCL